MHTESDVIKRKLFSDIVDILKSVVFSTFPNLPLQRLLASDSEDISSVRMPLFASASFHWGMLGSTLGIAHIGDALESLGDGVQLQKWQRLCASILRIHLNTIGSSGGTGKRKETAEEDKPGVWDRFA